MLHRTLINGARGITATFLAYPLAERLEGRDVGSKLRALEREMARPFAERRLRSWTAVVDIVRYAAVNVPYYRDLFARIRFNPERLLNDAGYFQDIPYLTKDIIRVEGDPRSHPVWSDEICGWNALTAVLGPQPALLPIVPNRAPLPPATPDPAAGGGGRGAPNQ